MRRFLKILKVLALALLLLAGIGYGFYKYHYPYGWSHCCDIALYFQLREYAMSHSGQYPTGEATPEASLSLLYRNDIEENVVRDKTMSEADVMGLYGNLLRGKTVAESVVAERLRRGELLTPETCGWHYVEGLRMDDNEKTAIFWDKVGLDHNGGRLPNGGHIVFFLDGHRDYIPATDWQAFLLEQQRLLDERRHTRGASAAPKPWIP